MNDCIADPRGRLLSGSVFYNPSGEYPLGKLICVDTDGSARIIDEGFHLANGLGFSPDCNTLYFTDSVARTIFAYDYDVTGGTVRNRRVFAKVPPSQGIPDGLTVDAEGFVWSAEWYGSCIVRYDPKGNIERLVDTPAKQTSSLAFGGPKLTDIFITSAAKSEPMPIMPAGYDPKSGYFGGKLYHINFGIRGKAEFFVNIRPKS
jgi:sugar lactone lactonase YvrE